MLIFHSPQLTGSRLRALISTLDEGCLLGELKPESLQPLGDALQQLSAQMEKKPEEALELVGPLHVVETLIGLLRHFVALLGPPPTPAVTSPPARTPPTPYCPLSRPF